MFEQNSCTCLYCYVGAHFVCRHFPLNVAVARACVTCSQTSLSVMMAMCSAWDMWPPLTLSHLEASVAKVLSSLVWFAACCRGHWSCLLAAGTRVFCFYLSSFLPCLLMLLFFSQMQIISTALVYFNFVNFK